jgi:hypothetical protein
MPISYARRCACRPPIWRKGEPIEPSTMMYSVTALPVMVSAALMKRRKHVNAEQLSSRSDKAEVIAERKNTAAETLLTNVHV